MSTAAERRHLAWVASLPCAVCGASPPSIVHHIREGQGLGQRASHWLAVPICHADHVGPRGIHGDKSEMRMRKLDELDLISAVIARLSK